MDGYLKRRLSNPVYGGTAPNRRTETEWYASCADVPSRNSAHPLQIVRHEASARKDEPALKRVRHNAKMHCWDGYERTPGTVAGTKGSCRPKGSKKKKKEKTEKKAKKEGGASSSSSSSSDDDESRKKKPAKKD